MKFLTLGVIFFDSDNPLDYSAGESYSFEENQKYVAPAGYDIYPKSKILAVVQEHVLEVLQDKPWDSVSIIFMYDNEPVTGAGCCLCAVDTDITYKLEDNLLKIIQGYDIFKTGQLPPLNKI